MVLPPAVYRVSPAFCIGSRHFACWPMNWRTLILLASWCFRAISPIFVLVAFARPLQQPDLEQVLLTRRNVLLASSAPSQPPTTMLRQGTLLTPFLGIQCNTSLDLCWVWALQGLLLTRLFWPIPQNWSVGDPSCPQLSCQAPGCSRQTEWIPSACDQQCFIALVVINPEPKPPCVLWP